MSFDAIQPVGVYQASSVFANYRQRSHELQSTAAAAPVKAAAKVKSASAATAQAQPGSSPIQAGHTAQDILLNTDLASLQNALNAGDYAGAQKAFATLQKDLQKVHGYQATTPATGGSVGIDDTESAANSNILAGAGRTFQILA